MAALRHVCGVALGTSRDGQQMATRCTTGSRKRCPTDGSTVHHWEPPETADRWQHRALSAVQYRGGRLLGTASPALNHPSQAQLSAYGVYLQRLSRIVALSANHTGVLRLVVACPRPLLFIEAPRETAFVWAGRGGRPPTDRREIAASKAAAMEILSDRDVTVAPLPP